MELCKYLYLKALKGEGGTINLAMSLLFICNCDGGYIVEGDGLEPRFQLEHSLRLMVGAIVVEGR
jgi:hypothetical protein